MMKPLPLLLLLLFPATLIDAQVITYSPYNGKVYQLKGSKIYQKGWIDFNKNGVKDIYEDPSQPIDNRVEDLLSKMTVEEKTCQMVTLYGYKRILPEELPNQSWKKRIYKDGVGAIDEQLNGFIQWGLPPSDNPNCWPASRHAWALNETQRFFVEETRLGIPVDFTNEGIRGVEAYKATNFPTQLGLGHTWDRELIYKVGRITGEEAKLLGYTNVYAPILDVGRDQRWGRYEEVYGESPFLVAELAVEMVKGIQEKKDVTATSKHFLAYSNNKGAREGMSRVDPQFSLRELENIHAYPWIQVIKRANLMGVMCAYNDYDGVPIEGSYYWLTEQLRKNWGFKGYVVSDSGSVEYLYYKHRTAKDHKEAVRQSVVAGLNVCCTFQEPEKYVKPLRQLIEENAISMDVVDQRVREILRVKFLRGLFDMPYQLDLEAADKIVNNEEHNKVALRASLESIVLLKNKNEILPLKEEQLKKIAVIGPNADAKDFASLHYGPLATDVTSVLEGIKTRVSGKIEVVYEKGVDLVDSIWPLSEIYPSELSQKEKDGINRAVELTKESDVAVLVMGGGPRTCGENKSRTSIQLPGHQEDLIRAVYKVGKPVVLVMINGRPNSINWEKDNLDGILEAWYPGSHGGTAIAQVLFGDYNPGGKLTVTFPKHVGQIPFNFPYKPYSQVGASDTPGPKGNQTGINGALFPFGFGLSYTKFDYSDLKFSSPVITTVQPLIVSFKITNSGKVAGDEVPQLYVRDLVSSVTTYDKTLRGFERVHLEPGETKEVKITVRPEDLQLYNLNNECVVEPGDFKIMIGASSTDIRLEKNIEVVDIHSNKLASTKMESTVIEQNLPWNFKDNDSYIIPLRNKKNIHHLELYWSSESNADFEVQYTSGGGQFLTLYKGKIQKDKKTMCNFEESNIDELKILIGKGKGRLTNYQVR